jgi:hypothetical protein
MEDLYLHSPIYLHGVVLNLSNHTIIRRFGTLETECITNKQEVLRRTNSLISFDMIRTAQKRQAQKFF